MSKISCSLLLLLNAALPVQQLYAGNEISRILQTWNDHYGAFAESDQYHYRCVLTRTCKKPGLWLNHFQLEAVHELGLEIFRLGRAARMDAVLGGDFSSVDKLGATHIFDGRAGITIQPQGDDSRYFRIYSSSQDIETVREGARPTSDPLAAALGR